MTAGLAVRFVLVKPRNSLNIGAVARAMANFGLRDLAAVEPFEERWREAVSAVGAEHVLRRARRLSLEEAVAGCQLVLGTASGHNRRARQPVLSLPALGAFLAERVPPQGKVAVLFGSEKIGLRNADLQVCHALVRIPTASRTPSMNLGQAAALVAYELVRSRAKPSVERPADPAPVAQQISALLESGLGAMRRANYNQHMPEWKRRELLRRMLNRWQMSRGDAAFLQGLLRRLAAWLLAGGLGLAAAPARAQVCDPLEAVIRREVRGVFGRELSCRQVRRGARLLGAVWTSETQGVWTFKEEAALRSRLAGEGLRVPEGLVAAGVLRRASPAGGREAAYVLALDVSARAAAVLAAAEAEEAGKSPRSPLRLPGRGGVFERIGVFAREAGKPWPLDGRWVSFPGGAWEEDQRPPQGVRLCLPCEGWLCPSAPAACFSDFDDDGWEEAHWTGLSEAGAAPLLVVEPAPDAGPKTVFSGRVAPVSWRRLEPGWAMIPEPLCPPGRFCGRAGLSAEARRCPRPRVWGFRADGTMAPDEGLRERAHPVSTRRLPANCSLSRETLVFDPVEGFILFRP